MLPGSDFGLDNKRLLSRIAFVDFNGEQALKLIDNNDFNLSLICPKIIIGINKLKEWVKKN